MNVPLLIVAVPLAFFAIVATFGTREPGGRQQAALENAGFVIFFALAEYVAVIFFQVVGFVCFLAFLVVRFQSFLRGWNYLFVAHSARRIVSPALRGHGSVDVRDLASTLASGATDEGQHATFHYEHQAEKAHQLKAQIETETAVIEARLERERRRAEFAEAERLLEAARRRSEKAP